jgi:hypothetical protein
MRDQPQELSSWIVGSARGIPDRTDPSAKLASPAFQRCQMADEDVECCFSSPERVTHVRLRARNFLRRWIGSVDHLCTLALFHRSLLGMNRLSHVRRVFDKTSHWPS